MATEQSAWMLTYSDVESSRFGMDVFRGSLGDDTQVKDLVGEIQDRSADLVILRMPCERQERLSELANTGLPHLICDTLVYYQVDLDRHDVKDLRNHDLEFVQAGRHDEPLLDDMVNEIFPGYQNHYTANPLIRTNLLPAYQEWVHGYVRGGEEGKQVWIARRSGTPVAFATCLRANGIAEGVLYGVRPAHAGGGVYGDLIRHTQRLSKELGCSAMKVSTQVQNYAVQKVWAREGFTLRESLHTVHIMAMMGKGLQERRRQPISFTEDQITSFSELSGDRNPLHLDDEYARSKGFEGRLAHGVLVTGAPSKYFGMEKPGPGTLFLGFEYRFTKPVYPGRTYWMDTGVFPFQEESRFRKALVRIYDDGGRLCLFGYNNLYLG